MKVAYSLQVEKDEEYIKSVVALSAVVEDVVKLNNAIDIYEEYFAEGGVAALLADREPPSVKTLTLLKDPSKVPRGAQYLSWQPDGQRKVRSFQQVPSKCPPPHHHSSGTYRGRQRGRQRTGGAHVVPLVRIAADDVQEGFFGPSCLSLDHMPAIFACM